VRASLSFQLYERSRGRWRKIGEASSPLAGAEFGGKSWLGWDK